LRTAGAGDLPLSEFRFYALINQRTDDGDNIGEHLAGVESSTVATLKK
jgi:hypothetical protein